MQDEQEQTVFRDGLFKYRAILVSRVGRRAHFGKCANP